MIEILLGPIQLHILGCSHIKQGPGPEKYRLIYQYNLKMLSFLWSNSKSMFHWRNNNTYDQWIFKFS